MQSLFSGQPATLKNGIERALAERYVRAFTEAGAECRLLPIGTAAPAGTTASPAAATAAAQPVAAAPAIPGGKAPAAAAPSPVRIARFWARPLAFIVDMVLLGAAGAILGSFFFEPLVKLGQAGRLVGFAIAILYFGLLNSRFGRGQTLGKRLLKIRVVDAASGRPISLARSGARYLVLSLPFFCNNLVLPFDRAVLVLLVTLVVFGLGGVTLYLYLANRRSRQSLHDLAAHTLVVQAAPAGVPPAVGLWRGHLVVAGLWLALVVGGALYGLPQLARTRPFAALVALQQVLMKTPGITTAQINSGATLAKDGKTNWTAVTVSVLDADMLGDDLADEVAKTTLARYPAAMRGDRLTIRIVYGYDIGIATSWKNRSYSLTPNQWAARLNIVEL